MKRENERADVARRMYVTLGRPSQGVFESIIRIGSIINNPVTIIDYQNALRLYGKDLGSIKGRQPGLNHNMYRLRVVVFRKGKGYCIIGRHHALYWN